MEFYDAPKMIEFGIKLGKDSVDRILEVLRKGDLKEILAYIDEEAARGLFFAFADLEIHKNIEYIASSSKKPEYLEVEFLRAFSLSEKIIKFSTPKFDLQVERG